MARPITWQDVAAPNVAAPLAASAAASEQIGRALTGLGNVGTGYMDDTKELATKQAVASIMSATDPAAAAQAIQPSWQIDPFAVQQAVDTVGQRRQASLAAEAGLASSKTQNELNQNLLADRIATRQGEDLALDYRDAATTGKKFHINDKDPKWKTAAGTVALNRIDNWVKEYNDTQERNRARSDRDKETSRSKAERAAADKFIAYRASPAGTAADATELRRQALNFSKEEGAGEHYAPALMAAYGGEELRGRASAAELETNYSPEGIQYKAPVVAAQAKNSQLQSERNAALSQFDTAIAGVTAMGKNDYKDMSPGAINAAVLKNNVAAGEGMFAKDWDVQDVQQRRDYQAKLALKETESEARELGIKVPKGFVPLTPAQEANLVELTIGAGLGGDNVSSDAADAQRKAYIQYNLFGGKAEIDKRIADKTTEFQTQIDRNNQTILRTEAAARTGEALPQDALALYDQTPERQLEIQAKAAAAQAAKAPSKSEIKKAVEELSSQQPSGRFNINVRTRQPVAADVINPRTGRPY